MLGVSQYLSIARAWWPTSTTGIAMAPITTNPGDERAYQERRVRRGQHRDRGDEGEAHREPAHSGRDAA